MTDRFIDAAVLLVPAICVGLSVILGPLALWVSRVHFGKYIKEHHRATWVQLVGEESGRRDFLDFLSLDSSPAMAKFRTTDNGDLGDPEVRIRRARANWSFKALIWIWIGGVAWFVAAAIGLIAIGR